MSVEAPNGMPHPIELLYRLGQNITPADVQAAINSLDPDSPKALEEAEEVAGWAEAGSRMHPEDDAWAVVLERATKIFHHRQAMREHSTTSEERNSLADMPDNILQKLANFCSWEGDDLEQAAIYNAEIERRRTAGIWTL